jgi:general secretion pathway protein I
MTSSSNQARGFSLVEVMIALLILAGGIMVVGSAWSGNFARLQKSRINNTMALLLQRKMTEIEVQVQDKPNEELKDEDSGTFDDYPGYKWTMKAQEFEMPDLTSAFKSAQSKPDPLLEQAAQQLTSFISKMVKEVTVTVSYKPKKAKREISNSVTEYVVDYKKEINLPSVPGQGGGG